MRKATRQTARCACWNGWEAAHKIPDFCLVGEPTSKNRLGDVVKMAAAAV